MLHHLCSQACVPHVDGPTGRAERKDLAGSQSSRSNCRCWYLRCFHVVENKERQAANSSGTKWSCSQALPVRHWSRQETTSWMPSISTTVGSSASSLCTTPEKEGFQDSPLVMISQSLGSSAGSPSPAPPQCGRQGQIDDSSPHPSL